MKICSKLNQRGNVGCAVLVIKKRDENDRSFDRALKICEWPGLFVIASYCEMSAFVDPMRFRCGCAVCLRLNMACWAS